MSNKNISYYSVDLRGKAMLHVRTHGNYRKTAKLFNIHVATLYRWNILYKKNNNFQPQKIGGSKGKVDKQALLFYVEENPNLTLKEIGKHFEVSAPAVCILFKKLGVKYKKKTFTFKKQILKKDWNICKK